MDKLIEMKAGHCIEDMDMFGKALVLYMRSQGTPGIRVLPFCKGDSPAWLILSRLVPLEPCYLEEEDLLLGQCRNASHHHGRCAWQ